MLSAFFRHPSRNFKAQTPQPTGDEITSISANRQVLSGPFRLVAAAHEASDIALALAPGNLVFTMLVRENGEELCGDGIHILQGIYIYQSSPEFGMLYGNCFP